MGNISLTPHTHDIGCESSAAERLRTGAPALSTRTQKIDKIASVILHDLRAMDKHAVVMPNSNGRVLIDGTFNIRVLARRVLKLCESEE